MKFLILIFLVPLMMTAQNLEKHKWEHRLLIISSPSFQDEQAVFQLNILKTELEALKNRKLVVYHITNSGYTFNFEEEIFPPKNELHIKEFSVSLIGLDGGQKYNATSPQAANIIFSLIDEMPMRRAEIKNR